MFFKNRTLPLSKSRQIFQNTYDSYKKMGYRMDSGKLKQIEEMLHALDQALLGKEKERASDLAKKVSAFTKEHCKKPFPLVVFEYIVGFAIALLIATIVRQTWFELYEIPTGSMRPTFKEKDRLTVTKTAFGINVPMQTKHFMFDPKLVERTGVVIFSADELPLSDTDDRYFWIFPAKKRFIKRLVGKPGDSIYFYGGKLYGVDKNGRPLKELQDTPAMERLEYIPFLSFDGTVAITPFGQTTYSQFHKPIARFAASGNSLNGEVFNGTKWVREQPAALKEAHGNVKAFADYFGIKNFAQSRLLNQEQLKALYPDQTEEGVLYLELAHTPTLSQPLFQKRGLLTVPVINPKRTVIPLKQEHLDKLMDTLYTARFVVKGGAAKRYDIGDSRFHGDEALLPGVEDGTYEFYHGKAVKIGALAIASDVPKDSALYKRDPATIQTLYNLGIQFNTHFSPDENPYLFPSRYAYFRDGALFLMGKEVIGKDDKTLATFKLSEAAKEQADPNYIAFKDFGAPVKDGEFDAEFIRTFGITIPEKNYLVLGDNHAMSSDGRIFGFVPEQNLEGAPSLILWPPGDRQGFLSDSPYPTFNTPRTIVWIVGGIAATLYFGWLEYHKRRPQFKSVSSQINLRKLQAQ